MLHKKRRDHACNTCHESASRTANTFVLVVVGWLIILLFTSAINFIDIRPNNRLISLMTSSSPRLISQLQSRTAGCLSAIPRLCGGFMAAVSNRVNNPVVDAGSLQMRSGLFAFRVGQTRVNYSRWIYFQPPTGARKVLKQTVAGANSSSSKLSIWNVEVLQWALDFIRGFPSLLHFMNTLIFALFPVS